MFCQLRRLIELEKKGTTVDSLGINRGLNSEEVARDDEARQVITRELTGRAESYQGRFNKEGVQHGLTETDVGPVHAETPQAGSGIEGYKRFLEHLGAMVNIKETKETLPLWMIQLGLGCALVSTCWVGGRFGYKRFRTIRGNEDDSESAKLYNTSQRQRCHTSQNP